MDPSGLFVVTWFLYLFEDTRVSSGIHPRSYPRNQTRMKENLENTSGISHYQSYLSIYTSRSDWPGLVHGQLADSQRHKFGHTAKLVTPLWELMSAAVCWLPDRAPDFLEKFWPIMAIILHIAACCFMMLPHGGRYFLQTKASAKEPGGKGWSEGAIWNFGKQEPLQWHSQYCKGYKNKVAK